MPQQVSLGTGWILALDNAFTLLISGYTDLEAGNASTLTIAGLQASTTYYYRVHTTPAASPNSNIISVATYPLPPLAPIATQAVTLTNRDSRLGRNAANRASGYRFDLSTSPSFDTFVAGYDLDTGNLLTLAITGLNSGTLIIIRFGPTTFPAQARTPTSSPPPRTRIHHQRRWPAWRCRDKSRIHG